MLLRRLLYLLLLLPLSIIAVADDFEISLDPKSPVYVIEKGAGLYFAEGDLGFEATGSSASLPPSESPLTFISSLLPAKSLNRFHGGSYWYYAKVKNESENVHWVISPSNAIVKHLNVYLYKDGSVQEFRTGFLLPDQADLNYGFDFDLETGKELELLVFVESDSFAEMPSLEIIPKDIHTVQLSYTRFLVFGSFGALFILAIYNAFIGMSTRDRSYLYYSAYLLTVVLAWSGVSNFFPNLGLMNFESWRAPFFLTMTFNTLYYIHFLELPKRHPRLSVASYVMAGATFVLFFTPYLFSSGTYSVICGIASALWISLGLFCGIYSYTNGYKPARYFVLAFAVLFFGVALLIVEPAMGYMPFKNTYLVTLTTQTIDMLLLALALADRINILRKDQQQAMSEALAIKHQAMLKEYRANTKLQNALDMSEQESDRKTRFLRMISHELRTPLQSIVFSVDKWKESDSIDTKEDMLNFISYGTSRLRAQIDNMVLLAETEDKYTDPNKQDFELRPLLTRLCDSVTGLLNDKVEFVFLPSEDVGVDKMPIAFNSDAYLIEHLLRSVLENACKYTEFGKVEFSVNWSDEEKTLKVEVIDTGCGMTEEQQKKMFNAFVQVSQGKDQETESLSLGLTLCYRLSEILDADFQIDSELGVGTRIHISIPLEPLSPKFAIVDTSQGSPGTVLIVEDNQVNAQVLELIVRSLGYKFELACSGQQAIERLSHNVYDVILMDVQMPVMDGITATRWMRRRGTTTPIIAVTANSDPHVRRKCVDAGMNDLVVKPVCRTDIQRAIERQLPNSKYI